MEFPGLSILKPSKQFTETVVPYGTIGDVWFFGIPTNVPFVTFVGSLQNIATKRIINKLISKLITKFMDLSHIFVFYLVPKLAFSCQLMFGYYIFDSGGN